MKRLFLLLALTAIFLPACASFVPAITTFEITPPVITAGSSASLIWNAIGANTVTIEPGLGTLPAMGSRLVTPGVTTAYTISVSSPVGTISRSVVLTVNPAPVSISFYANPAVLSSGGSSLLQWNVAGATDVSIDQGIGPIPSTGSKLVSPQNTTTYTLTAANAAGKTSRTLTVAVNPPIQADLSVSPSSITYGQQAILTWNVTGADSVSIDQGIGQVPASGNKVVAPDSTTSYTLTASSSCCVVSKAAVVNVGTIYPYGYYNSPIYGYPNNYYYFPYGPYPYPYGSPGGNQSVTPFIEIFNVSPNQVKFGQGALLQWNVLGATSVDITGVGSVPANGVVLVVPTVDTTYTLNATNAYASTSQSVSVQIVP